MVQFLEVPVNGNWKNFENLNSSGHELFIFNIVLIAIDWNFFLNLFIRNKHRFTTMSVLVNDTELLPSLARQRLLFFSFDFYRFSREIKGWFITWEINENV